MMVLKDIALFRRALTNGKITLNLNLLLNSNLKLLMYKQNIFCF